MKADVISSPLQTVNGVAGSRNLISDAGMPGDFIMALMAAMFQQGTGFDSGTGNNLLQQELPASGRIPVELVGTVDIPVQGNGSNVLSPVNGIPFNLSNGNMLPDTVIPEDIPGIPAADSTDIKTTAANQQTAGMVPVKNENINLSISSEVPAVANNSALPVETGQRAVPVVVEVIEAPGTKPVEDNISGVYAVRPAKPDSVEGRTTPAVQGNGVATLNITANDIQATQQSNQKIQSLTPDKALKIVSVNHPGLEQDRLSAATESQSDSHKDIVLPEGNKKIEVDKGSFSKGQTVEALKSAENSEKESPNTGFTGQDESQGEEVGSSKPGKYAQGDAQVNNGTIQFSSITAKKFPTEIVPYVLNAVRNSAGENSRVTILKLKLEPQNLGEIKIRLAYSRGELTAHFFTTSGMVKEAVEFSLPQLRETLSQYNIDLGEAAAHVGQEHQSNSGSKYSGYRFSGAGGEPSGNFSERQPGDNPSSPEYDESALNLLI